MTLRRIDNQSAFSIAREQLQAGESVEIRVMGQSMLPFFRSGSRIVLRPILKSDLRRGVVVMAETANGHFVVHRIYRIEADGITLLGDGNIAGTERVSREKIYGTVDCSSLHLALARLWQWIRPLRRYPLAILRRIFPE